MNYKRFLEINRDVWSEYLTSVSEQKSQGWLYATDSQGIICGSEILFPAILLITETKNCFIAELLGAKRNFEGLTVKCHKDASFEHYISQFPSSSSGYTFKVNWHITFEHLCLSKTSEYEKLKSRFPAICLFESRLANTTDTEVPIIRFDSDSNFLTIKNCLFINTYLSCVRAKHILHLVAIQKDVTASEYEKWLREPMYNGGKIPGVHVVDFGRAEDFVLASQFTNTYLTQGLRETTIGEFLKLHPDIIKRGLNTQNFVYEPYLPWLVKSPENKDSAINPDLLIERTDGFYDIYDLKTALLNKNLTKGERRRRRFVDYVQEGIAQLANYAEYFTYQQNCEYAFDKYGVRVKQPNLVLVVGHFDNANRNEIEEASRQLNNISVIDYDSFLQLFLLSNSYD